MRPTDTPNQLILASTTTLAENTSPSHNKYFLIYYLYYAFFNALHNHFRIAN